MCAQLGLLFNSLPTSSEVYTVILSFEPLDPQIKSGKAPIFTVLSVRRANWTLTESKWDSFCH